MYEISLSEKPHSNKLVILMANLAVMDEYAVSIFKNGKNVNCRKT